MHYWHVFTLIMLPVIGYAQLPDTMALAISKASEQSFDEALELLVPFQNKHGDFESLRMMAEIHYWMQDFQSAEDLYRQALRRHPLQYRVHLELGRVLVAVNAPGKAREHLQLFLDELPDHPEANYLMGVVQYWMGNVARARGYLANATDHSEGFIEALELAQHLDESGGPRVGIDFVVRSDDQPLDLAGFNAAASSQRSSLFAPSFDLQWRRVRQSDRSSYAHLSLANTVQWWQAGMSLTVGTGILHQSEVTPAGFLWQAKMTKSISPSFSIRATAERKPYTWTSRSLLDIPLYESYHLGIGTTDADKFQFEVAWINDRFRPELQSHTLYGWLLSPPVAVGAVQFRFGYSYSFADSDSSTFVPVATLEDIIVNFDPEESIAGIFDPYFTPENIRVHSVLAKAEVKTQALAFSMQAGLGISASAHQPFLYLDLVAGDLAVVRGFFTKRYTPLTLNCSVGYQLSDSVRLAGDYVFFRSLFYRRHSAAIGLTFNLSGQ